MGDLTPMQLGGIGLIVVSLAAMAYGPVARLLKTQQPVRNSSVPTMQSYMASVNMQKMSYETALERIAKLESELEAIRQVVGVADPDNDDEVTA